MSLTARDRGSTWSRATCLAAAISCSTAATLFARDTPSSTPSVRAPRLNVSFAGDQSASQKKAAQKKKPSVYFRWQDHPTIHIGKLQIGLRARLQFDRRA